MNRSARAYKRAIFRPESGNLQTFSNSRKYNKLWDVLGEGESSFPGFLCIFMDRIQNSKKCAEEGALGWILVQVSNSLKQAAEKLDFARFEGYTD